MSVCSLPHRTENIGLKLLLSGLLMCLALNATFAEEEQPAEAPPLRFEQLPEVAPSQLRDAPAAPVKAYNFQVGDVPEWIWGPDDNENYRLQLKFELSFPAAQVVAAPMRATCDNGMIIKLNGKPITSSNQWQTPVTVDVRSAIKPRENILEAEVTNEGGIAGFLCKLMLFTEEGQQQIEVSGSHWKIVDQDGKPLDLKIKNRGKYGVGPWKNVFDQPTEASRYLPNTFVVPPGFQVEKLFTVPKEELGSWVAIAFDDQGRLLASDQGKLGICRITPSPIGSEEPTVVEKLKLPLTSAQGMLYAFDSLYLSINGGPGSGLYRARDTNGDDQFDEVIKLKEFRGGGEHGPHALRLGPDGKSIYVICGNHTAPPFPAGAEQNDPQLSSRIPTNWNEDLLLPRQWDANGHARGVLAPGGWIAKTDADGETWEIVSMGYRNPYDMDFNREGDLFTYDADMEWDMGTPWYRPTRVVHATSGSEFGWRSGTGKWPTYYHDSLPQTIDIGPGSPVGVCFGYGARFPAKYQEALFICDWTFGTMYAIHLIPHGSSYQAIKEEFVARSPLPLTDNAIGPDGALYFTIGGRGAQSELYRVRYVGSESTADVLKAGIDLNISPREQQALKDLRKLRRDLEAEHVAGRELSPARITEIINHLGHEDRFIRYAARIALEHQPVSRWGEAALQHADPRVRINGATGLARQAEADWKAPLSRCLLNIPFASLPTEQQLELLRTWQLVFIRLGEPDPATREQLLLQFDPLYPQQSTAVPHTEANTSGWLHAEVSPTAALNRELLNLLVFLQAETVAEKVVQVLKQPRQSTTLQLQELLARNRGYAGAIANMMANQPDLEQVHAAFAARNLQAGWTRPLRQHYFQWFQTASQWSGGNSYRKFLQNISDDAFALTSEVDRVFLEASGARAPFKVPELPKPQGPGHDWTVEEVLQLAESGLTKRNYENGKKMFAATRCIVCHRFAGEGGATGPDLTQLAGRFNLLDLTEAIVLPSKVISDQYKAMQIVTEEGKVYVGRIITETPEQITLLLDPEDATKVIDLKLAEIEEMQASPTSLMPADLLKPLNQDEVLDLLAYLLSRGDDKHQMFRK